MKSAFNVTGDLLLDDFQEEDQEGNLLGGFGIIVLRNERILNKKIFQKN